MALTLLQIVQEVAGSLNLPVPTSVVGNTDPDPILFFNLAKQEGRELARRHDWQDLVVEHTWTSTATEAQSSALPSDYDHLVPDVEIWDRSSNQKYIGPVSSVEWMRLNTGISGGVAGWWRIIGGVLNVYPAPSAGQTFALEYVSKNWCESSVGTGQAVWAADTDVPVIPDYLFPLGLRWRWLRAKGMDYAEEMATYERELEKAAARDRGMRVMFVSKGGEEDVPPQPFWNGTIDA